MKFIFVPPFVVALLMAHSSVNAVTLNFNYDFDSNGFFGDFSRRSTLEAAGAFFESRINDDLAALSSAGGNAFSAKFTHPGTGSEEIIDNYNVSADTLVVFAGGRSLDGNTLGIGGAGGVLASGNNAFLDTVRSRGETGATGNAATATDFGPWGGALTFDTDTPWYFDQDATTDEAFSGNDFYSAALHELAHLLGFGTSASWKHWVNGTLFSGPASGAVELAADARHWQEGITSSVNGVSQATAMDPFLAEGNRKRLTDMDLAGLQDVGWEITPVPLPPALLLFGSGLAVFARRGFTVR